MSIYNIPVWSSSVTYSKWGIAKYNDNFYYSLTDNNSNNTPAAISIYWGGMTSYNGVSKPAFIWQPSYNSPANINPAVKSIKFGDNYEQLSRDGINNTLLSLDLNFDLRTQAETTAICHFLFERAGVDSFVFTPLPPFDIQKLFVCRTFVPNSVFYDNNSIRAKFDEMPV